VMREANYSCLMMPQTGPAMRGLLFGRASLLVASSIARPLPRIGLSNLVDQLFDEYVAE
jgi:hypothetical protein